MEVGLAGLQILTTKSKSDRVAADVDLGKFGNLQGEVFDAAGDVQKDGVGVVHLGRVPLAWSVSLNGSVPELADKPLFLAAIGHQ